jgi:hypothetical protein
MASRFESPSWNRWEMAMCPFMQAKELGPSGYCGCSNDLEAASRTKQGMQPQRWWAWPSTSLSGRIWRIVSWNVPRHVPEYSRVCREVSYHGRLRAALSAAGAGRSSTAAVPA